MSDTNHIIIHSTILYKALYYIGVKEYIILNEIESLLATIAVISGYNTYY